MQDEGSVIHRRQRPTGLTFYGFSRAKGIGQPAWFHTRAAAERFAAACKCDWSVETCDYPDPADVMDTPVRPWVKGDARSWPTIIVIEDHMPDRGHYYHSKTLAEAVQDAKHRGCHAARVWCYDHERYTHEPSKAVHETVI